MVNSFIEREPTHPKESQAFARLQLLVDALNLHSLPDDVALDVNSIVDRVNASSSVDITRVRELQKAWLQVVALVRQRAGLTPRKYHSRQWMMLGMVVFGLSFGVAFSLSLGSFAFIGLGLPVGMAIGMAVGDDMDKKAAALGNQLDVE
ncbi:MAG: hypothetical protein PHQ65_02075 [Bacteroidales bacterium]|nr:hypothetical protein [Bacteroidales bacterium]MDD3664027.1 hypothetical protein [Bacteroidales bacterium]